MPVEQKSDAMGLKFFLLLIINIVDAQQ